MSFDGRPHPKGKVRDLLGHKDINITPRHAHLAPSHKVKAVEVLEKPLKGDFHVFFTSRQERETATNVSH